MKSMELLVSTLDIIGSVFIAYAALRVHHRVLAEHQVDDKVFKSMKREQKIGITGAVLIVAGYIVELLLLL